MSEPKPFYDVGHLPPWPLFWRNWCRRLFCAAAMLRSVKISVSWWQVPCAPGRPWGRHTVDLTFAPDRSRDEIARLRLHWARLFFLVCSRNRAS